MQKSTKKSYVKPTLKEHGTVREVTQTQASTGSRHKNPGMGMSPQTNPGMGM
jgi:hypothetical protein